MSAAPPEQFDLAPVALAILEPDGTPRVVNRRFRELLGRPDDLAAPQCRPILPEADDRVRLDAAVASLAAGEVDRVELEVTIERPDGHHWCGRVSASPVPDPSGGVGAVWMAVVDVSEDREVRASLERSLHRIEAMLSNISDTVTLVDADGGVLETTGLHTSVMGYDTAFWQDRSVFDLVDPDDLPRLAASYEQVLASPCQQVTLDLQLRQADGGWADVEVTAVNLLEDPSVGGVVITSRNITDRKRTEVELAAHRDRAIEQARLRSEFVARVSHELRNQLHALRGLTELLTTTEVPRSVAQLIETANRQAEQFGYLIDDLLEFSSFEAGRVEARVEPCWSRQIVSDVVAMGRELAADDVAVLGRTDEDVADVVMIDERRARQVLTNLVTNAAKFTRTGYVEVHAQRGDLDGEPALRWTVRDTGRGIPTQDLEQIFLPFEQGSARSTRGSGLGLAITERIVTMLGGRIEVTSKVGRGSEFTVTLPAAPTDEVPADPERDAARLRPRVHVLVVEDNEVNQLLVAEQLARLGVRSVVVGTGLAALEHLSGDHSIDCVLMDWQLPELDGVETTRRYRAMEPESRHLPIIGMTASGRPSDRAECLGAGMDDLLVKPVGLAELSRALQPYLGERRTVPREPAPSPDADTGALDSLVDQLGSVAPVRSIITTFLGELDRREEAIEEGLGSADADLVRRTAHTLRSMTGSLGANQLDRVSRELERGDFPPTPETVEEFHRSIRGTRTALEGWLAKHAEPQESTIPSTA